MSSDFEKPILSAIQQLRSGHFLLSMFFFFIYLISMKYLCIRDRKKETAAGGNTEE